MLDWLRLPFRIAPVEIEGHRVVYRVQRLFTGRCYETWEWPSAGKHNLLSRAYRDGMNHRNLYRLLRIEAEFIGAGVWSAPSTVEDMIESSIFKPGGRQP